MPQTWEQTLQRTSIEHGLLCTFHEQIERLVRLTVAALVLDHEKRSFEQSLAPVVQKLLSCLQETYQHSEAVQSLSLEPVLAQLSTLGPLFRSDIEAALLDDPATSDPVEVMFCYPGFKAVSAHRIAHIFYRLHWPLLPRMIAERAHQETGIDIHPGAQIGSHFFIDHGTGTVIGETAIIGNRVTLYQGVTLGAKRFHRDQEGMVIKGEARHPILGDQVTVYSGATILGRIMIGEGSIIGGNVWLTESVPSKSRITQQQFVSHLFRDGGGI